jgi:hypothetical protein
MTSAPPLTSMLAPALAAALDVLGRPDDAALVRRAEGLLGELMQATGERRIRLRAELAGLVRELGDRARALLTDASLSTDVARLARELGSSFGTEPAATSPLDGRGA